MSEPVQLRLERVEFYDRAQRLANQIAGIIADAEHWNAAHPNEEPVDPDPGGVLHELHGNLCAFLATETREPAP